MKHLLVAIFLFPLSIFAQDNLTWETFDGEVFKKAEKENKLVLLYVEANWCHWCHVMQDSCYDNTEIQTYLKANYILAKADQDERPDVFQRYKEYGWPATIIFDTKATEIVKRRGYISPEPFLRLLNACVADPTPEPDDVYENKALVNQSELTVKQILKERFYQSIDLEVGGFDMSQKYVALDPFELALNLAPKEKEAATWLQNTMEGALKLCDPVWGGVYQYSTDSDWEHVHFEKLLDRQARYIRMFALYYQQSGDQRFLDAALQTYSYCERFLKQNNGLYANAQDADLTPGEHSEWYYDLPEKERLEKGIPTIDTNTYTANNAKMAESIVFLWAASGNEALLKKAVSILKKLQSRTNAEGLVKHSFEGNIPYALEDQLYVLSALFVVQQAYPNAEDLKQVEKVAKALITNFQMENGAFKTSLDQTLAPLVDIPLHLSAARLLNNLGHILKVGDLKAVVKQSMAYLASQKVLSTLYSQPQYFLALEEIQGDKWVKVMFVEGTNPKSDVSFRNLFLLPQYAKLVLNKNSLQKTEYTFDSMPEASVYICTETFCSQPLQNLKEVEAFLVY